ncbi:hypothetical protein [Staphylococcus phage vB_SsapH-Golestan101-M]|nr:hypothetical protein [Staphylococcus phage vB_SsapH-Golestan101-M]
MMNSFSNFLSQEQQSTESNFNNNQQERYQPKNKTIRLNKQNPEIIVRVLPGVKTQEDTEGLQFFSKLRSIFLNYVKGDGTATSSPFTLPFTMGESVLDSFISNWKNNNVKINDYNTNPAQRYLVNVIPLVSNQGQFQYQVDPMGNILVAPMELTKTLFDDLSVKLQDENLMPTQDSNLNFISENHAFAVKLYRTGQGTDTSYKAEVYQRQDLGQLPQGWENLTSDIQKMAEPTEENSPGFVNFVINSINGTDKSIKNFDFEDDGNTAPSQSQSGGQAPSQQQIDNQMPSNLGAQTQSQPVEQQQPVQQSQPTQQGNVDWNNLAQQQSQPEPEQSNPWAGVDLNSVDDSQVPFNTQPQQQQQQQSQPTQTQQQAPQQNQQPQQQPQQQPNIPQEQQSQNKMKSVDDILGNIGL